MTQELLKYFKGDKLAAEAWYKKYRVGNEQTPDDMHLRLARQYAEIEYDNFINSRFANRKEDISEYGQMRFNEIRYHVTNRVEREDAIEDITKNIMLPLLYKFGKIIPGGSVMSNLGAGTMTSLSNCFVAGQPDDTIESIFDYAKDAAQLYKRRGGVGIDVSKLRPRDAGVNNASKTSTGSVSFMELYSYITTLIGQEGRRGALMLSQDVRHPDILEFITVKQDLKRVTGANISIKTNAEFMKAVENDENYLLTFPTDWSPKPQTDRFYSPNTDKLQTDGKGHYWRLIRARKVWDTLIESAHRSAEPGILFWDKHLDQDPSAVYDEYRPVSTNPCGEIPLQPKDSCRLSAANLYSLVRMPFTPDAFLDEEFAYSVFYEQHVMSDNIVDLEIKAISKILAKIEDMQSAEFKLWFEIMQTGRSSRRVGNGFTALADMFAALGVRYGSEESLKILQNVMRIKMLAELDATIDLSILRGSFGGWNGMKEFQFDVQSVWGTNAFFQHILEEYPEQAARMMKFGRRNVSWSTVAPTGTVSIMAQTSSGIEPVFSPYYKRRMKVANKEEATYTDVDGQMFKEFMVVHPKLQQFGEFEYPELAALNTEESWKEIYEKSPYKGSTSADVPWKERLAIQSIVQKYTSHSISSTLNLPAETTVGEVDNIYRVAYKMGLKGITIYRDGSRGGILVSADADNKVEFHTHIAPKRPRTLQAHVHVIKSKGVNYVAAVGLMENKPYEIFVKEIPDGLLNIESVGTITKVKKGEYRLTTLSHTLDNIQDTIDGNMEKKATALYVSMLLRTGANLKFVIKTAKKVDDNISSFTSALCRVLSKYVPKEEVQGEKCPECGESLMHEAGCVKCTSCTYSKCLMLYSVK